MPLQLLIVPSPGFWKALGGEIGTMQGMQGKGSG